MSDQAVLKKNVEEEQKMSRQQANDFEKRAIVGATEKADAEAKQRETAAHQGKVPPPAPRIHTYVLYVYKYVYIYIPVHIYIHCSNARSTHSHSSTTPLSRDVVSLLGSA